ncbi:hypothetical protein LWI28_006036 [Acer negundo]|uniref:NAC domain-containing protein n=1 Tax=Acer negundo TaxID=4023 RepID=A0AAD5ILN1_ACENE|nr:hypothetical protein LWI28_006036 [Acer negundo]KAK4841337.1 hypothetical protein QYF36_002848 [Acer negundo]
MEQQQLTVDIETEIKKLPVGFRFEPRERDMIVHYLVNKILNRPLPSNAVKDINYIYHFDPDQLPISEFSGYCNPDQAYFFTQVVQGGRRTTKCGYWKAKASGSEVPVLYDDKTIVGFKKSFRFYSGDEKSNWIIHEYRVNPDLIPANAPNQIYKSKIDSYVICKIQLKDLSD